MGDQRPSRVAGLPTGCFYVDDPILVRIRVDAA